VSLSGGTLRLAHVMVVEAELRLLEDPLGPILLDDFELISILAVKFDGPTLGDLASDKIFAMPSGQYHTFPCPGTVPLNFVTALPACV
jgi:hypothetical protein